MSAMTSSSRRALMSACSAAQRSSSSVPSRQLHSQHHLLAGRTSAGIAGQDPMMNPPSAGGHGYGGDHHDDHHDDIPHRLFDPPYHKAVPLGVLAFCVFGGAGVISGCIMYQQKKGGFWFKKKTADK